jgi:hypothetical protein
MSTTDKVTKGGKSARIFWAAAKHELHSHESVIAFRHEADRDAFVSNGGGLVAGEHTFREARAISESEAVKVGALDNEVEWLTGGGE